MWGIVVIVYYFYSFPNYGEAFISSVALFVTFALLIANILALFKIVLIIFWPSKKIKDFMSISRKGLKNKINDLKIPVYYLPLSLYFFTFLWIIWIYARSSYNLGVIGNDIITIILVSWIFLISFSLGCKTLKIFKYKTSFFLEKFLFSCALGFGALMFIVYFLGMFGLYYRIIAYVLMIIVTFVTYKEIIELWTYFKDKNNFYELKKLTLFGKGIFLIIPVILGIDISGIFQQFPSGFDAFISYLTYPKIFVENHGIVNFPYWIYYGFPQNGEMLFTLGYLLFNFQITLALIFIFTLLIVLCIYYFFRKNKLKGGVYAIIAYLTLPVIFFQNLEDHKIEMIFVFYTLISYCSFINYLKKRKIKDLIIFSVFCGIAAGLKYFFLTWYIVPLVIFFLVQIIRNKIKVKYFFIWGLIIFIFMLPWFVRNIKFSGNPIDPILSEKLASKQSFYDTLGRDSQKYIVNEMRNEAYLIWDDKQKKDLSYFLNIPFDITYIGNKKYISDALNIGFTFILFAPVIIFYYIKNIFYRKLKREFILLLFATIILYFGWVYIGHVVIWYAISLYVLFFVLLSQIFFTRNKYLKLFLYTFLSIWIITIGNLQFNKRINYMSLYSPDPSISRDKLYLMSEYLNNNLDNKEMIWGLDQARGYYIDNSNNRYIQDHYLLYISYLLKNNTEEHVIRVLKNFNIRYFIWRGYTENISERILWAKQENGSQEYANFTLDNYKRVIKFKNKHMDLVAHEGEYYLYKLKEE